MIYTTNLTVFRGWAKLKEPKLIHVCHVQYVYDSVAAASWLQRRDWLAPTLFISYVGGTTEGFT